ncbi:hypothetical protein BJV82DRAFT_624629 [Fennellomyces sp. T-0311]|nr:hypothetical protein BJV82DRAFT_624629 [Fennellomyces sp. T-0311]
MHINRKSSSSSSSGEERLPRRSNSFGQHKRSLVASLTHGMPTTKGSSLEPISPPASDIPFVASTEDLNVVHDPALFRPSYGGVNVSAVWESCTMRGWMTKHIPPSYSFTKTKKRRFVILADRMLYTFKVDQPTPHYREFFELTKDTIVFVTDYISGAMYCIEITKIVGEKKSWYMQCDNAEHMKLWLDRLKKTVAWLREGDSRGVVTSRVLAKVQTEHDALVNNVVANCSSSSESIISSSSSPIRSSLYYEQPILDQQDLYYADQYEWDAQESSHSLSPPTASPQQLLPPQQPPPRSAPPPPPIHHYSSTAMHFQKFEF